jgi:hypothetical protein
MLSITFSTNRFVHVASVRRVRVHPDRLDALDKQPPRVALFFFLNPAPHVVIVASDRVSRVSQCGADTFASTTLSKRR